MPEPQLNSRSINGSERDFLEWAYLSWDGTTTDCRVRQRLNIQNINKAGPNAQRSAASAQSFFDFDDLPPAGPDLEVRIAAETLHHHGSRNCPGVSEHIADSLQPQAPKS